MQGFLGICVERYEAFLRWLFECSAPIAFFLCTMLGAVLLLASIAVGIGSYEFILPSGDAKQIGYIWAPNWSLALLLLFPIMLFFMLETADSLRRTLDRIIDHKMIVDAEWMPIELSRLDAERNTLWRRAGRISAVLSGCLMLYVVFEWYFVSGLHLIANEPPIKPGATDFFDELDWSVAAVLSETKAGNLLFRIANGAFSFINYVILGFYLSIVLSYFTLLILYADLFRRMSQGKIAGSCRLIPDVNDDDPRRGFGIFTRVFQRVLLSTVVGFVICYFTNIQNAFLRSDATNVFSFVASDLASGFSLFFQGEIRSGIASLADSLISAPYIFNLTAAYSIMAVYGFFALVTLSVVWTLSQAAERGRDELRLYLKDKNNQIDQLTTLERKAAQERLGKWDERNNSGMITWPFGWPSLRELFIFLAFGLICVFLYRIGLVYAGIAIAWVTASATTTISDN